ncbi:MAG: response regulator [Nitrospirae bacterium]|nr:response regulator [Nitrospirota bacterium]
MAKKLLVVDSNLAIQKLIEHNLSREKFEVTCLNDGLSALDLLAKIDPDLILVDYHVEGISFARFCEKIKQKSSAKERPILVLISAADNVDAHKLFSFGVVDFVKKPLEPKELIEKLQELSQDAATVIDKAPQPPLMPSRPATSAPLMPSLSEEEQTDMMKIEDLLGWSLPGEKRAEKTAPPPESRIPEPDNEQTIIQNRADLFAAEPPPAPAEPPEAPTTVSEPVMDDSEQTMIAMRPPPPPSPPGLNREDAPLATADAPEIPAPETPPVPPAILETVLSQHVSGPETLEAPAPAEAQAPPAASGAVSSEMVEALVSKLAREVIEKVAWDVIPNLAEILIKEELDKLKTDKPS